MRFFYIALMGFVFIIIATLSWQFFPVFTENQGFSSLEVTEADPRETEEHHHHEETLISLSEDQIKESGVQTDVATPGELSVTISTRGKIVLHPDKLVHILPKISGIAKEARKNIGDRIKEGEVLAVLESRDMADLKAHYLAAKEKESYTLSLMERERRLYERKVSAEQDYLNAKSAYAEAKINFQLAGQKLSAFGIDEAEVEGLTFKPNPDLTTYSIRSPMDGIVIARHINKGEFVENTETIYEIADVRTVWVEIGVYPKDLPKVKDGQMVDIFLPAYGKIDQAKIIYLSPIIDDETITAKAIAELSNPNESFRPGSFVNVSIATENLFVPLMVPNEAIQEIEGKEVVFIKVPEGFELRQVQTGAKDNKNTEILSGLSPGETYANSKTFLLKADLGKAEAEHDH